MPSYHNPIVPGFTPDPSVCRAGDDFFLVTSSFEYFPGVPLYHSLDLVHWRQIGHVLTRKSQLNIETARSSGGIFAPTIRFHDGRFYMVTTDTRGLGNFLVHAADPFGEWSEPVKIPLGGIDPSLSWHGEKCVFVSSEVIGGVRGAWATEIDPMTGAVQGEPRLLWQGTGQRYDEAPHLYEKDGWYYLLMAEGGTEWNHCVTIARRRALWGPYEGCPQNPIFTHRGTWSRLQSTGHGDLFQDARGDWWMVFLGVRHVGATHHLGRETCLAPVSWPEGGWPQIPSPLPDEVPLPNHWQAHPWEPLPTRDDFDADSLPVRWQFRRNPVEDSWSLTRRKGFLSLRLLPASLDDPLPQSFVGVRQSDFAQTATTRLEFAPNADHEEAGLCVLMRESHYAALVVTRRGGKRVVLVRRKVGPYLRIDSAPTAVSDGPIQLRIVATASEYVLQVFSDTGWQTLEKMETKLLSTELAGGFTGVVFGLFATSSGHDSDNWADFDFFELETAAND